MKIGVFVSETWGPASTVSEIVRRARKAEALGFPSGWVPYLPWSLDALASLQAAGQATDRLELGTAVIPTYFQHPLALARTAATVQAAIGRSIHLGVGCSNEAVIAMHGLAYDRPARHTREYVSLLEAALRVGSQPQGEREQAGFVQTEGELFEVASIYGTPGTSEPGSLLVGALGERMLRVAGGHADGTIATWSNEKAIAAAIVPPLREAAAKADRPPPTVAGVVPTCIVSDPSDASAARAFAQTEFQYYESMPRYKRMMDLGRAAAVSEVCVIGTPEEVAERLHGFEAAGMTDYLAAPLAFRDATWDHTAEQLAALSRAQDRTAERRS